jgi:hypothetical protein
LKKAGNLSARMASGQGRSDVFPSTHWSVVFAAGRGEAEPEMAGAALAELCQGYWAPLYGFVRSRGHTVHDAQDLTQSFFAYMLEQEQLFKELRIFIAGGAEPPPTYAEVTVRLGITESTLRSHVTRLRARYREALRTEVRRTVDSEKQVDQELRELLHVLTEI